MTNAERLTNTLIVALNRLAADHPGDSELLEPSEIKELASSLANEMPIQVVVSGGVVQSVSTNHALAPMLAYELLDFDIEGSSGPLPYLASATSGVACDRDVPVYFADAHIESPAVYSCRPNPEHPGTP